MSIAARNPLLRLLRSPDEASRFGSSDWEDVVWHARKTRLGGRVWELLVSFKLEECVPRPIRRQLSSAFIEGEADRRRLLWELDRIRHALGPSTWFVALKGAAYAMAGLDLALGRPAGDIDIMVPREAIAKVESLLLANGWKHLLQHDYDQSYYRRWMHEIPPLIHTTRGTELDLHHTILPLSSRLHPDAHLLCSHAITIVDRIKVLAPVDMVLHSAVHLFYDGEIRGALRDLVDIDALLREFARRPGFWSSLTPRARELGLERPLFYAIRYTTRLLSTPVLARRMEEIDAGHPSTLTLMVMDWAVEHAIVPSLSRVGKVFTWFAGHLLYMRSHYLRMSVGLLSQHLANKSRRRLWSWYLRVRSAHP